MKFCFPSKKINKKAHRTATLRLESSGMYHRVFTHTLQVNTKYTEDTESTVQDTGNTILSLPKRAS